MAHAQSNANVIQRSFINLGFEEPNLRNAGCRVYINQALVPGWTTDHQSQGTENPGNGCDVSGLSNFGTPGPIIEIWRGPRSNDSAGMSVRARAGEQFAELNAAHASRISQNVCLEQGDTVRWKFSHRGRKEIDRMNFLIGEQIIAGVETSHNGHSQVLEQPLGPVTAVNSGVMDWFDYSGEFIYSGVTGPTNIGFRAMTGSTTGNFLDDIQVFLKPVIELTGGDYSTVEGTANNPPSLMVVGHLENLLNVRVTITGGTAVLGEDFNTPGGGTTFNVLIPARAEPYEGTLFPLGLTAPDNTLFDGTRTVEFQLEPDDAYFTRSTTACGAAGTTAATWNILDNDVDLSMDKDVTPKTARAGDDVTYTLTTRSDAEAKINVTGAVVRDPPVAGLDCSNAAPVCSATRPELCAPNHSITTLQTSGMVLPEFFPGEQVELKFVCKVTADGTP